MLDSRCPWFLRSGMTVDMGYDNETVRRDREV
jgi:hypothetical protein